MWTRNALAFLALIVAVSTIGAASAADMPAKVRGPVVDQKMSWTGFYLGLFGGYHAGNITQSGCVGLCPVDPKIEGGLFGIQAGYDYEFSNHVVLGAFGWVPLTRPKSTVSLGPGLDFHVNPTWAAVIAGRVGYAFDRWLPYVFGGVGFARVEVHSDVTGLTPSNDFTGPVVGFGVEYAILPHVSIDLRYMYSTAPKADFDFGGGVEQYGERASNFLASVNYRF